MIHTKKKNKKQKHTHNIQTRTINKFHHLHPLVLSHFRKIILSRMQKELKKQFSFCFVFVIKNESDDIIYCHLTVVVVSVFFFRSLPHFVYSNKSVCLWMFGQRRKNVSFIKHAFSFLYLNKAGRKFLDTKSWSDMWVTKSLEDDINEISKCCSKNEMKRKKESNVFLSSYH